jgi:hypothetical protein
MADRSSDAQSLFLEDDIKRPVVSNTTGQVDTNTGVRNSYFSGNLGGDNDEEGRIVPWNPSWARS